MAEKPSSAGKPRQGGARTRGPPERPDREQKHTQAGVAALSRRAPLEDSAPASVVVDRQGLIRYLHGPVHDYLDMPSAEPDLEIGSMVLPGLKARLRAILQRAWGATSAVSAVAPRVRRNAGMVSVRMHARVLSSPSASDPLCLVSFADAGPARDAIDPDDAAERTELQSISDDLSNLLSNTDMATLFLDGELRTRRFTPAAVRLLSLQASDVGRPLVELAPRIDDPALLEDARRVLDDPTPLEADVRGGGQTFIRRITPYRTADERIDGVVITFADVTSLKRTADLLENRERQQAEVAALGRVALSGEPLPVLLDRAVRVVAQRLDVDLAKVLRLQADGQSLVLEAGVGWQPGLVGTATEPAAFDSQAGYTLKTGGPVIFRDLVTDERFQQTRLLLDHGVVSGLSVVIGPAETPWGVFGAHARRAVEFSIDDTNFLLAVANVLWQAIRRDAVEAELITSEARTRAFLSNSAVVGWLKDEDGRYVYVSETFQRQFGIDQQDWIGKTDHELWPPEVAGALRANDERARRGDGSVEMTEELVMPDGRRQHWLVSKFPFVDASGKHLVGGLAVNITERVAAERALEQNERRLRSLIDTTAVGVAFANGNGDVTRANDALLSMLGLTRPEVARKGLRWADGLLPEDRQFAAAMQRLSRHSHGEPVELQRLDAHGRPVWFLASAVQTRPDDEEYVAFLVNITRQKLAESALADSEDRLRLAARLAGFGAYYGDLRTGQYLWSEELLRIFGLDEGAPASLDELPGPVVEEDRERVRRMILASVDPTGDGRFHQEYRVLRPDGETRWILMQGRTVFRREHDRRRPSRVAGVALDITQRHRFEEELDAARRDADAANEAKSQFLANMSHEIRTPLTAILGFAEVLEARLDDDDARVCAHTIMDNGKYLCELLDDILELEKIESGRREVHLDDVEVVRVLADVRALMSVPAEDKNLALSLELEGLVPRLIRTDARFLRQVLLNLVGNALKFTTEGSVRIVCRCRAHRERLEVDVVDTGIGIAEEDRERLFEPFEQGDTSLSRSAGGTGLGLAISRDLLDLLGGDISFDSRVGAGSTFRFSIPTGPLGDAEWIDDGAVDVGEISGSAADLPALSGRVLVVDDRRDIRVLVREFIEAAGGEVILAENGAEALDAWRSHRHADTPLDAVIMDVQMPVLDGLEATRRLRAEGYAGAILALTATIGPAAVERALAAGCSDLIAKPIDRADLLVRLDRALRGTDEDTPQLRAQRILVVDDHQDSNAALKMLLELRGWSVATAGDAHAALARAREAPPDIALIDLGLPEVPGHELLQRLKALPELAACRFVCVSGRTLQTETWQSLGFDDYLVKPVGADRLFRLLGGSEAAVEAPSRREG